MKCSKSKHQTVADWGTTDQGGETVPAPPTHALSPYSQASVVAELACNSAVAAGHRRAVAAARRGREPAVLGRLGGGRGEIALQQLAVGRWAWQRAQLLDLGIDDRVTVSR